MAQGKPLHLLGAATVLAAGIFAAVVLLKQTRGSSESSDLSREKRVESGLAAPFERRATSTTALPPPGTPAIQVVRSLEADALNGSAPAACRIAQELWRCVSVERDLEIASALAEVPALPVEMGGGPSFSEVLLNQSENNAEHCSEVDGDVSGRAYMFQARAADRGGHHLSRWLVVAPMLRQEKFLDSIDDWADYKTRAEAYVSRAIKMRDSADLMTLLLIHTPDQVAIIRPVYRVDDEPTFLALEQIAKQAGIAVPSQIAGAAVNLRRQLSRSELSKVNTRFSELMGGWRKYGIDESARSDLEQQWDPNFCL